LSSAFAECRNLNEITLPDSLQIINSRAFHSCIKLKEIFIPVNVKTINDSAFAECKNLTRITVAEGNTRFAMIQDCLVNTQSKKLLQGLATGTIPQDGSVTTLGQYCFASMPITSITIPDNITTVSNNAFSHCEELQIVKLPSTLQVLDATCFAWCYKLAKIDLPEGLTDIRTYVFDACALTEVTIPASVNNVLAKSFGDMPSLQEVTFKKALNADGTIKIPNISSGAFTGSGSVNSPIKFNVPWSKEQHIRKFAGYETDGSAKDPFFGAINGSYENFTFDYEEEAN
jgi:hypothetical protein